MEKLFLVSLILTTTVANKSIVTLAVDPFSSITSFKSRSAKHERVIPVSTPTKKNLLFYNSYEYESKVISAAGSR